MNTPRDSQMEIKELTSSHIAEDLYAAFSRPHPEYTTASRDWTVMDIVSGGWLSFVESGAYLATVESTVDSPATAEAVRRIILNFTPIFNCVELTLNVYNALLMQKAPIVRGWDAAADYIDDSFSSDVDGNGTTLTQFTERVCAEVLKYNRVGVFVDFPTVDSAIPLSERAATKMTAVLKLIKTRDILTWNTSRDENGRDALYYVIFKHTSYANGPGSDFFTLYKQTNYSILILEDDEHTLESRLHSDTAEEATLLDAVAMPFTLSQKSRAVRYEFFCVDGGQDTVLNSKLSRIYTRTELSLDGKPMNRLPFYFIGGDNTPAPQRPGFVHLAELNRAYYMLSARVGYMLYYVSSPVPWSAGAEIEEVGTPVAKVKTRTGGTSNEDAYLDNFVRRFNTENNTEFYSTDMFKPATGNCVPAQEGGISAANSKEFVVGVHPSNFLVFRDPAAKVGWLTLDGGGLAQAFQALDRMEKQMAIVGAKQLNENHKAAITAETANIERIGENANLASYAQTISQGMTNVLLTVIAHGEVRGTPEDISNFNYIVTVETLPQKIDATELTALLSAMSYHIMSKQDALNILIRRGVLPADTRLPDLAETLAMEKTLFEDLGLSMPMSPGLNGDDPSGDGTGEEPNGTDKKDAKKGGDSGKEGGKPASEDGADKKPSARRRSKKNGGGSGTATATPNSD